MATLTLANVKEHLRIDSDFTDDDAYLNSLIDVAKEAVVKHLNIASFVMEFGDGDIPSPIIHAMKLLIGTLYNNREASQETATQKCEYTFDYLLSLYRNYPVR